MKVTHLFSLALSLVATVHTLSPAEWRTQSIYFLLTDRFARSDNSTTAACDVAQREYCGGSWQGVINQTLTAAQLDYIQDMGFTAIWITPVTGQFYDNTGDGMSYHGYWQQDIYVVNEKLGTSKDLRALSDALHARGMYMMVDVVANHMGFNGAADHVNYTMFTPFNAQSYFHTYCPIIDYNNQSNVEQCWLGDANVSLVDLATDTQAVQDIWYSWVNSLVANYSIDGLRVDTVKHVQKPFWSSYNDAAGVFCIGEVLDGDAAYTCPYQNYMDSVLNYPMYYALLSAFQSTSGSVSSLYNMISQVSMSCADTSLLGNFIENHDNPRFPSYTGDLSLAKNALAFIFLSDGIPIVYAGQEQHYNGGNDPHNREAIWASGYATDTAPLYGFLRTTNQIRQLIVANDPGWVTSTNEPFYQDGSTIAMRKGSTTGSQVLAVLNNQGEDGGGYTLLLGGTEFAANTALTELYTCVEVTSDASGNVGVPMASGLPRVLVPSAWVKGSGMCGTTSTTTSSPTSPTVKPSCTPAATVPAIFNEKAVTSFRESVYLSGSLPELGAWNTSEALPLSASAYTASSPVWSLTVELPAGASFSYKFFKTEPSGQIVWESDPDRTMTVPQACAGASVVVAKSWK